MLFQWVFYVFFIVSGVENMVYVLGESHDERGGALGSRRLGLAQCISYMPKNQSFAILSVLTPAKKLTGQHAAVLTPAKNWWG